MSKANYAALLKTGRQAGVLLPVASLPGPHGIGDLGRGAYRYLDFAQSAGLGVWQFLPLGPTAYGDSPYQALSTFAGNELYIDLENLRELGLLADEELAGLRALPAAYVDYPQVIALKWKALLAAAGRFDKCATSNLQAELDQFCARHDTHWLHDYALFRVLKAQHRQRPWTEWPQPFIERDPVALKRLEATAVNELHAIKVLQFLFNRQWQLLRQYAHDAGVTLFGDMPIYIALDSADAWSRPEMLRLDANGRPLAVAGVPPDYFSADGQLWGNPLYDWQRHAKSNYGWWINRIRSTLEQADIIRIDHFRGFESYWAVAADALTARLGQWETGPGDALFEAVKKELGELPIVAEDLGIITPEVEALRDRLALPGMTVLQFAINDEGFDLARVAENRVCYTGTHDNDTTLGWYRGSPGDLRSADDIAATRHKVHVLTSSDGSDVANAMIKAAFSTKARLAIAPLQDYLGLGSEARLNIPGTTANNWRWRVTEAALSDSLSAQIAGMVDTAGRRPPP
ncbi:4-alpha-glucanotransferase [Woeseia oceani]|uniref:4-alpha-glucanotransferase n=1 Tax=Woeseia oceani TaxID=1548547 RepID=UPI0009F7201E|nr:4-alpha-glucanotransferase [Woeseia oceani]